MNIKCLTPYIHINENEVSIIGSEENLIALSEMILLKVKLKNKLSATWNDGINKKTIKIILDTDMLEDLDKLNKK